MSENIFEEGTRLDVQFSYKGQIGIPDLWQLDFDALNSIQFISYLYTEMYFIGILP